MISRIGGQVDAMKTNPEPKVKSIPRNCTTQKKRNKEVKGTTKCVA